MRLFVRCFLFLVLLSITGEMFSQVINIEEQRKTAKGNFYGNVDLSFEHERSKSVIWKTSNRSNLYFRYKKSLLMSFTNWTFSNAGGEKLQHEGYQHMRYNLLVDTVVIPEVFGQYQFNDIRYIDYRALAGVGVRLNLFSNDTAKWYLGTSVMYEERQFTYDSVGQYNWRMNLYMNLDWNVTPTMNLSGIIYFQPSFHDFYDQNISMEGRFRVHLIKQLSLVVTAELAYETNPPVGINEYYSKLKSGFYYSF
ncbi:MAG: DUF481 domain-containing protein [Salinivirgaceae bacterium]|jgi:hypothetical protein|nr:DUF481 domain-containing protein [Salinivirgaceae bacterium]